ncbi:hypothetical protein K9L67_03920 [Candidatus Woesearchaeota archaeon]|nr:hypothetical protein [Candidatus Woesearchaeota archaeon]MCF7901349.1 hypothetical protein [Candidatus Woesearchaeota archaeon]MCF8013349.1 hypothetical protein [Candidatus Woesearchaeota archaeon]
MVKNHMKRLTTPKTWRVARKTIKFITKPQAGGYKQSMGISINTFLKELTNVTNTTKETNYLMTKQEVLINGTRKRSRKHLVGFLESVIVPSINKSFRLIMDDKGKLKATEIKEDEAKKTIVQIIGKTKLKGTKIQLNTLSGNNILVEEKDAKEYKTGDSLLISLPDKKIQGHIKREKGNLAFIYTGKHAGKIGSVENIHAGDVLIKTDKESLETKTSYIIIVGTKKAEIIIE